MRLCLAAFLILCMSVLAGPVEALSGDSRIDQAWVDWTKGAMLSHARTHITGSSDQAAETAKSEAAQKAIGQIISLIESTGTSNTLDQATKTSITQAVEKSGSSESVIGSTVDVTFEVPLTQLLKYMKFMPLEEATPAAPVRTGPFTSLVVDTLGLKVERAMSPKIRRTDGSEVWGTVKADYDFVEDSGIIAYSKSMEDAMKNSRAGKNPLIVKAVDRAGGKFYCDAVIDDIDAKLVLDENTKTKFLDNFKVIFVVDGNL